MKIVTEEDLKKKESIGTKVIDKVTKAANSGDIGPEARDVTKEWGKKFLKDIEEIINNPKYLKWDKIYIKVLAKKTIYAAEIVNVVYGITSIPPSPSWKNMLYSFDRKKDELVLEWLLPQAPQIADVMLKFEEGFDAFLINCIKDFKAGKLIGQSI